MSKKEGAGLKMFGFIKEYFTKRRVTQSMARKNRIFQQYKKDKIATEHMLDWFRFMGILEPRTKYDIKKHRPKFIAEIRARLKIIDEMGEEQENEC